MAHARSHQDAGFKEDGHVPLHRGRSLAAEAGHLADEVADGARSRVSELRHGAKHAVEAAKDSLGGAHGAARQRYESAKDAATDAAKSVKGVILRNPVAAAGAAVGVVVVLGLIVRRFRARS